MVDHKCKIISTLKLDLLGTTGLCGTFDEDDTNDNLKPDGTAASDTDEFIEAWRFVLTPYMYLKCYPGN